MKKYPCVLSIAGSDCSGGAGIQADIKTISAAGVYAASAVTAVTVQNTCGVSDVLPVPPQYVAAQIEAVMSDIHPDAVKIGMVSDADTVRAIAECLSRFNPRYIVFDPVMVSSSGRKLMSDEAVTVICQKLFPLCTLITPNIDEASMLLQRDITTVDDMKVAARELLRYGSGAVLLKGGHLEEERMTDILQEKQSELPMAFDSQKVDSHNTHGTGCTLSSAIAARLALGYTLAEAVGSGKDYVHHCLESGKDVHIGEGHGPMNHLYAPEPMHIFYEKE